jgi:hypothetical protein
MAVGLNLADVTEKRLLHEKKKTVYFCFTLRPDNTKLATEIYRDRTSISPRPSLKTKNIGFLKDKIEKYNDKAIEE